MSRTLRHTGVTFTSLTQDEIGGYDLCWQPAAVAGWLALPGTH